MYTLLIYHLIPFICRSHNISRWVLEEIMKSFTLVHQSHLEGKNNRYCQFAWPLSQYATTHLLDTVMNCKWHRPLYICTSRYFRQWQEEISGRGRRHPWHFCDTLKQLVEYLPTRDSSGRVREKLKHYQKCQTWLFKQERKSKCHYVGAQDDP